MTKIQEAFIAAVAPGAQAAQKKYGILASLTIAQAICESGWGESGLTRTSNNLFGIKWTAGCGYEYVEYPTKEWNGAQYVSTSAKFRKYDSWAESLSDHAAFLIRYSRYKNLINVIDYKKACQLVQADGYATSPTYAITLIGLIETYDLARYDAPTKSMGFSPAVGKMLVVQETATVKCEYWAEPDTTSTPIGALEKGAIYRIIAFGDTEQAAGQAGTWCKLEVGGQDVYTLSISGRAEIIPERYRVTGWPLSPSDAEKASAFFENLGTDFIQKFLVT